MNIKYLKYLKVKILKNFTRWMPNPKYGYKTKKEEKDKRDDIYPLW